jgi:hypothetical protein
MRLDERFLKLPKRYCAETMAAEVRALPASAWVAHPAGFPGNDAVLLVSQGGKRTNAFIGPMAPTEYLQACPYIMKVMADIGAVWGRSRLMGLAPGADVRPHIDTSYHWRTHLRIHIPVITNPDVLFACDGEIVHMAPGECWLFDSFRMHGVRNSGSEKRIHLVLDTVGDEEMWDLMAKARQEGGDCASLSCQPGKGRVEDLKFEQINFPRIMSPWEIQCHLAYLFDYCLPDPRREAVFARLDRFACGWASLWARFGEDDRGIPSYRALILAVQEELPELHELKLKNRMPLFDVLKAMVFQVAVPWPAEARRKATAPVERQRLAS